MPLVELSPGKATDPAVTARLKALLEGIGKVPVVCAPRPGYIVPRIQALAMNEAARMVEEGVASAEEIDKAIKYGFGFRFAVLGMLEFIDWGGGDILYYASRYLTQALGSDRYAAPAIVERNMQEGRIGLGTRQGFLDYENLDVDAYRARAAQGVRRHAGTDGVGAAAGAGLNGLRGRRVGKGRADQPRNSHRIRVRARAHAVLTRPVGTTRATTHPPSASARLPCR